MKKVILILQLQVLVVFFSSFHKKEETSYFLTVKVNNLRNSIGEVQFALYNQTDAFPDEHYTKTYRKLTAKIVNGVSEITFEHLPPGRYAVNILHDENSNGKIDKNFFLPIEGIGFSNYSSIGIVNRPTFEKASFTMQSDLKIKVKIIYL